jgi:tetratricopeptide (TPR) repeat protein
MLRLLLGVLLAISGALPATAAPRQPEATPDTLHAAAASTATATTSVLDDPFVRRAGKQGLDLLYDMQFEAARARFDSIDARYPNHPVGPFLKGLNIWWAIMLDLTDTSHDEAFLSAMDEVIARCDELLDEDADHFDATFFKGAALGFRGRLHSNRGRWFKAALDGKSAIGYVRDIAQRAPENDDYVFGKGMYDYYAAIIPEEYPVSKALMWMMPDGNKERGLELLRRSAEEGWYIQTEAVYFLTQIHYLYEDNFVAARERVRWLRETHPNNPYFHVFEGRVYARWGYWQHVADVFQNVIARCEDGSEGYNVHMEELARYYLARSNLYAGEYEEALKQLAYLESLTDRNPDDPRYRVLGYLYQGMVYDAMGRREMAVGRYHRVLRMEDASGAHDRAEKYLETPYGS